MARPPKKVSPGIDHSQTHALMETPEPPKVLRVTAMIFPKKTLMHRVHQDQ